MLYSPAHYTRSTYRRLCCALLLAILASGCTAPSNKPPPTVSADALRWANDLALRHTFNIRYLKNFALSPDGHTLAISSQHALQFWDASSAQLLKSIEHLPGSSLSWSPDGSLLAVGAIDYRISLVDPASGSITRTLIAQPDADTFGSAGGVASLLEWSPDSRTLASVSTEGLVMNSVYVDPIVRLWEVSTGKELARLTDGGMGQVSKVVWSPDGSLLAVLTTGDTTLRIWDSQSRTLLHALPKPRLRNYLWAFDSAWSPSGHIVADTFGPGVRIVNADNGSTWNTFLRDLPPTAVPPTASPIIVPPTPPPPPLPTQYAALLPPGPFGSVAPALPTQVPPTAPPTPTMYFPPPPTFDTQVYEYVSHLAWSPDGSVLATYDIKSVRLWDVASGDLKQTLLNNPDYDQWYDSMASSLAWSHDGSVLLIRESPGERGLLRLVDPSSGQELRTFAAGVRRAEWAEDGRSLLILRSGGLELWGPTSSSTATPAKK